jgi:hypothetical protein
MAKQQDRHALDWTMSFSSMVVSICSKLMAAYGL